MLYVLYSIKPQASCHQGQQSKIIDNYIALAAILRPNLTSI